MYKEGHKRHKLEEYIAWFLIQWKGEEGNQNGCLRK